MSKKTERSDFPIMKLLPKDYMPSPPAKKDYGIGAVGCGNIARALPEQVQTFQIRGAWFPDAFGGSMGEMMSGLTAKRPPLTSGADNLNTIRIVDAAVRSSTTGKAIDLT